MINIGIDLSTTNTGIAIVKDNKVVYTSNMAFNRYAYEEMYNNYQIMKEALKIALKCVLESDLKNITVGIELANFEKEGEGAKFNPRLSQRFSQYVGMIRSILYELCGNIDIRTFNANEWFRYISKDYITMTRDQRKLMAREKIKAGPNFSEDEVDAICIAYLLPKCRDVETIAIETRAKKNLIKKQKKERKKVGENQKIKKLKLEKEIAVYNVKATQKKLTKPQLNKLARLEQELKEIGEN